MVIQNKELDKLNTNYFKLQKDFDHLQILNIESSMTIEKEVFFILFFCPRLKFIYKGNFKLIKTYFEMNAKNILSNSTIGCRYT
jgi:hypothetical protein